jgi:hypothetical protein
MHGPDKLAPHAACSPHHRQLHFAHVRTLASVPIPKFA